MIYKTCLALIVGMALGGCALGPRYQPLDLRSVALVPDVRVGKGLYTTDRTEVAVEGGATRISGSDSDSLNTGQIRIDNVTFDAPQSLCSEFSFGFYDASILWRQNLKSLPFGYELAAGAGYADLNITASSPTSRATESITSPAFRIHLSGIWRVFPNTRVEANATLLKTNSNMNDIAQYGIVLARSFGKRVSVHGGYSKWELHAPSSVRSSLNLRLYGPSIGLGFHL